MMNHRLLLPLALGLAVVACGRSPVSPSAADTAATRTVVARVVSDALTQSTLATPTITGDPAQGVTVTLPCPDGGSIAGTVTTTLPSVQDGPANTSTTTTVRMAFLDCRRGNVVVHGDPDVLATIEQASTSLQAAGFSVTSTTRMTGGLRFESAGVEGRARYDCTLVITTQYDGSSVPPISQSASGTIAWEQPIGTIETRPCGPA